MPGAVKASDNNAADAVLKFWFNETKPQQRFSRDSDFDDLIKEKFSTLHDAAANCQLNDWTEDPKRALALIIILDQFSRNIYRDMPESFAQDAAALKIARKIINRKFDDTYNDTERAFTYMPFMHAEDLDVQNESVALFTTHLPDSGNLRYAIEHRDIIVKFGRFPHRNKILGRTSTPEELDYLNSGGFNP